MTMSDIRGHGARWLLLSAFIVIADQLTKSYISAHFGEFEFISILPVLDITRMHNVGAAFSFPLDATQVLRCEGHFRFGSRVDGAMARAFFDVSAALVGCGHVSGLLMRRVWPLALMLCADLVPIVSTHF